MKRRRETPEGYIQFFDYGVDFETRTIMYGFNNMMSMDEFASNEVNDWSSEQFIKGMHLLDAVSHEPINVIWSSHGGEWDAGIAVYEFIRRMKSPVTITSYSRCRSMGTVIMQAADKRVLSKNSVFMIHYGMSAEDAVHSKNMVIRGEEEAKMNKKMEDIYLSRIREKHEDYSREELQYLMTYDKFMTPREAVNLGLADKVI